ncbi:MAG: hypothetical protein BTN85_2201 [Candidatus Methanohalarchaeum thermophilum]|uniref:Uncharacterized protein n=1 Tax=Methanohalarchaeum thermophilum TaxID=1903181 RepID=A0A1Q6DRV6_METT1|nr:MAG: hypothetical protein BTN85_2201 [Candidatus Methanohalarchaeum thermophilum]
MSQTKSPFSKNESEELLPKEVRGRYNKLKRKLRSFDSVRFIDETSKRTNSGLSYKKLIFFKGPILYTLKARKKASDGYYRVKIQKKEDLKLDRIAAKSTEGL